MTGFFHSQAETPQDASEDIRRVERSMGIMIVVDLIVLIGLLLVELFSPLDLPPGFTITAVVIIALLASAGGMLISARTSAYQLKFIGWKNPENDS